MIDRTWVVRPLPSLSTSQAHGRIQPRAVVKPNWQTDSLGGAGRTARALQAIGGTRVLLAGGWDDEVEQRLRSDSGSLEAGGIECIRIARTPFTTTKWRVYEGTKSGQRLLDRFDRDLSDQYEWIGNATWPKVDDLQAVVVADFKKGLLERDDVLTAVGMYSGCQIVLFRTKGEVKDTAFTRVPWTYLLTNRQELARLANDRDLVPEPTVRKVENRWRIAPGLWSAFESIANGRSIVAKLDREGAVLFQDGSLSAIALDPTAGGAWAGIGAGDMLMAHFAHGLATGWAPRDAVKAAVIAATAYCKNAEKVEREREARYGQVITIDPKVRLDIEPKTYLEDSVQLADLKQSRGKVMEHSKGQTDPIGTVKEIHLHEAAWYLEGFSTVNEDLGRHLLRLRRHVREYARECDEAPEENRRPFVGAICGGPGSGKSTLAKQLAKAAECEYVEENVAQWQSWDDLARVCERIRTIRLSGRLPLVFLDEVDALVAGGPVYGKLLAPLWDREYRIAGVEVRLGPTVFLLAGSDKDWRTEAALLSAGSSTTGDETPKLSDLVSRLSVAPVEVPEWQHRGIDRIYIAAEILRREFPLLQRIERGVLRRLVTCPKHGPRSIERTAWMFEPKEAEVISPNPKITGP